MKWVVRGFAALGFTGAVLVFAYMVLHARMTYVYRAESGLPTRKGFML